MKLKSELKYWYFRRIRGVQQRCSENMQQIYRRTPMRKCDFSTISYYYILLLLLYLFIFSNLKNDSFVVSIVPDLLWKQSVFIDPHAALV